VLLRERVPMFLDFKAGGETRLGLVPRLYIYQDTLDRLEALMRYAGSFTPPCEVQFYLTCTRNQNGNSIEFVLDELTFPPQEVQPAYVEASAEQQAAYSQDMQIRYGCFRVRAGAEPGTMRVKRYGNPGAPRGEEIIEEEIPTTEFAQRYEAFEAFKNRSTVWCHSHVNMAPNPSSTDEGQWKEWLKSFLSYDNNSAHAADRPPAVGMIIFNLKGHYFNRIKDNILGVIHENVPLQIITRNYYTESFLKSYVTKKVAAVTQVLGNSNKSSNSGYSGYSGYSDYSSHGSSTSTSTTHPSALSPGLTGVLFSYTSNGSTLSLTPAIRDLMKRRAEAFYEKTAQVYEALDNVCADDVSSFWSHRKDYISLPLSAEVQETIQPAWAAFNEGVELGYDIHGSRTKNENLIRLIVAIADAIGIERVDDIEILIKNQTDLGLEASVAKVYSAMTSSYAYCLMAIKLAQYLTGLQYNGNSIDYTFQKKFLDYLFNEDNQMTSHFSQDAQQQLVIATGVSPVEIEKARFNIYQKPMSFESLIWSLGVFERWIYGDNSFSSLRAGLLASFAHFNKKNFPPPMLRKDLLQETSVPPSGPRLLSSEEAESKKPLQITYVPDAVSDEADGYASWLKNEY